jgi:hypothetical protein
LLVLYRWGFDGLVKVGNLPWIMRQDGIMS